MTKITLVTPAIDQTSVECFFFIPRGALLPFPGARCALLRQRLLLFFPGRTMRSVEVDALNAYVMQ